MSKQKGLIIQPNMTIPKGYPYAGFVVTRVAKNGWCRGYYPSNVTSTCSVKEAMTSVQASWLTGLKPYRLGVKRYQ